MKRMQELGCWWRALIRSMPRGMLAAGVGKPRLVVVIQFIADGEVFLVVMGLA